jgi:carbon-monoxide dehydrogenase medium subunit
MTIWNHYYLPSTLDEAIELLSQAPGSARVIAGGTDLLLDLQQGRHAPVDTLVDVTRCEMLVLEMRGRLCFFGASVPLHPQIYHIRLGVGPRQALPAHARVIGGPPVRHTAVGWECGPCAAAAEGTISIQRSLLTSRLPRSGTEPSGAAYFVLGPGPSV